MDIQKQKITNKLIKVYSHKPLKAYDNTEFIHSKAGRIIRLISEYQHPLYVLEKFGVNRLIVFFGSARINNPEIYEVRFNELKEKLSKAGAGKRKELEEELKKLEVMKENIRYYKDAMELARKLSEWSLTLSKNKRYYICTGGGGGIMEAANRGAFIAGMENVGFNISLPYEQEPNKYISENLNFEFHYFFMRKFWFVYLSYAFIVFPGGFGTLDELMEILTLMQTKKLKHIRPIILYGSEFWKKLINFELLYERGFISEKDLYIFKYCDSVDEAFNLLKDDLSKK